MKKLYRSKTNRKIFGIAGGVGELYDMDPTLVRVIFVGLGLVTGGGLFLAYIIAKFIIPEQG